MLKNKLFQFIVPLLALLLFAGFPASQLTAAPQLPHYFYGTVKLEGTIDAPIGTIIEARGAGVINDSSNPITITETGMYGSANSLSDVPRLLVQGDIQEGALITFYVNNVQANETAYFSPGGITVLNLTTPGGSNPPADTGNQTDPGSGDTPPATDNQTSVDPNPPASNTGGGTIIPAATTETVTVTGLVASNQLTLNNQGQTTTAVTMTTSENAFRLNIPASTTISGPAQNQLQMSATPIDISTVQQRAPEQAVLLGYNFGPDGTQFSPPAVLTVSYDSLTLPQGISESDLKVAWWDTQTSQWVTLNGIIDPVTHTITVAVQHFTEFVILYDATASTATVPTGTEENPVNNETETTGGSSQLVSDDPNVVITEKDNEYIVSYAGQDATGDTMTDTTDDPAAPVKTDAGSLVWLWIAIGGVAVIATGLLIYRRFHIY